MGSKLIYEIGRLTEEKEDELNFRDGLSRSVKERIELGFVPIRLPVIEDKPYRVFDSMEEYRNWCNKTLPEWLGYHSD